jgi:transposase-like protein
LIIKEKMSQNNENAFPASQPTPEIFSDATNRLLNNPESPTKVYSASQPEPSVGILRKGRKSFGNGRRVSFAATAHVRVFASEEEAAAAKRRQEQEEEAEEQRQLAEFRKQFEVNNNGNVDELKESFNEFEIKSSPLAVTPAVMTTIESTPSKRPFTSIDQSFDGTKNILISIL